MARTGHPHAFHHDRAHGSMLSARPQRAGVGAAGKPEVSARSSPRARVLPVAAVPCRAIVVQRRCRLHNGSKVWHPLSRPAATGSAQKNRACSITVGAALPLRRPRARSKERRRSGARPVAVPLPTPPPPRIEGASDASRSKISAGRFIQTRPSRGPRSSASDGRAPGSNQRPPACKARRAESLGVPVRPL
jgi:hypothetical protein